MLDGGRQARLSQKSLMPLAVVPHAVDEHLQRDLALQTLVLCAIDARHSTLANARAERVDTKPRALHQLTRTCAGADDVVRLHWAAARPRGANVGFDGRVVRTMGFVFHARFSLGGAWYIAERGIEPLKEHFQRKIACSKWRTFAHQRLDSMESRPM